MGISYDPNFHPYPDDKSSNKKKVVSNGKGKEGENEDNLEDDDGGTLVHSFGGDTSIQEEGDKVCDIRGFMIGTDGPVLSLSTNEMS